MATNFAVVGNCQSRPLSNIIRLIRPDWNDVGTIVAHLSNPENASLDSERLDQADIIFAQSINDNYANEHLATSRIRSTFIADILEWPNIFFHGQNPDCYSIAGSDGRIASPLEDYHSISVFNCWRRGDSIDQAISTFSNEEYFDIGEIESRIERSFANLSQREKSTDVKIGSFVESEWRTRHLFHVFNHPTSSLLIRLACQLLTLTGHKPIDVPTPHDIGEPLGRLVAPLPLGLRKLLNFSFDTSIFARGREVSVSNEDGIVLGRPRIWQLSDFVASSYQIYDFKCNQLSEPRFTPNRPGLSNG